LNFPSPLITLQGRQAATRFIGSFFPFRTRGRTKSTVMIKEFSKEARRIFYPPGRRFDPVLFPVRARAEEHQLRRSYKGNPWKPTSREWRLFRRFDAT
jgi:hypothetical protein